MQYPGWRRFGALAIAASAAIGLAGFTSAASAAPASASTATVHAASGTVYPRPQCQPASTGSKVARTCSTITELQPDQLSSADQARSTAALQRIAIQARGRAASATTASPTSTAATEDPPSQCFDADGALVTSPDRLTSCGLKAYTLNDVTYDADGDPTSQGTFDFEDFQWASFNASNLTWFHGLETYAISGTDDLAEGFTGQLSSGCNEIGSICSSISENDPDPQTVAVAEDSLYTFAWEETDTGAASSTIDGIDSLGPSLGVTLVAETPSGSTSELFDASLAGRCDSVLQGSIGCVDNLFIPTVVYDSTTTPNITAVAQHVYTAQNGGLSTAWGADPNVVANGQYLTRDMTPGDSDLNRSAACSDFVPKSDGDSCDEFPLASTYQGAAFNSDYSTASVPLTANQSQGGVMSSFYTSNRVLDADPFLILAVLADGTASW